MPKVASSADSCACKIDPDITSRVPNPGEVPKYDEATHSKYQSKKDFADGCGGKKTGGRKTGGKRIKHRSIKKKKYMRINRRTRKSSN